MRNRSTLSPAGKAVAAAAAIALLLVLRQSASAGGGAEPADERSVRVDPRGAEFSFALMDRGATRAAQLYSNAGATNLARVVDPSWEVDITAVTVQSGGDGATGPLGTIRIGVAGTVPPGFVHFFDIQEPGTTHYQFDPPLPLRAGDTVSWHPALGTTNALVQATLHGYAPAAASGMAVK